MRIIKTTALFDKWFAGLRDREARARIQMRIDRAELGNFGDCKLVGQRVSEMRIHHGPGYRVYFVERGGTLVVLLAGGTKSGQSRDINKAIDLARLL